MRNSSPSRSVCLARLTGYLEHESYSLGVQKSYPGPAKRFFDSLERNGLTVERVQRRDVEEYLGGLRMVRKRRGRVTGGLLRLHRAAGIVQIAFLAQEMERRPGSCYRSRRS